MKNMNINSCDNGAHNTFKAWHPVLKPIGRILIAAQLAIVLQPLSALAQDNPSNAAAANPLAQSQMQRMNLWARDIEQAKVNKAKEQQSPADQASDAQVQVNELVRSLHQDASTGKALRLDDTQRQNHRNQLGSLLAQNAAHTSSQKQQFAQTRADLATNSALSASSKASLLDRHDQAASQYEQRASRWQDLADAYQQDPSAARLAELNTFLDQNQAARRHTANLPPSLDPARNANPATKPPLPWSTPKPTQRAPAETKTAWYQQLYQAHYKSQSVKLAQATGLTNIAGLQFTHPPEPTDAPTAADLAETPDIQLSADIKAKALELGHNPVNIHNWVASTIQWQPTWGSIQGAQGTLKSLRGNATDIASLHIALLRASAIPARYQMGTIEVSTEQLNNWIGGTQSAQAAQNLLGQGGIAARGIIEGGRITKVRMEHVWVNAYVNWAPGRGARAGGAAVPTPSSPGTTLTTAQGNLQHPHPNAALNAWVPLDASYKQYRYTAGMNLQTSVPLDATALLAAVQQGTTINQAQGYVQNLNQAALQAQLDSYQTRLKDFITTTPLGASSTVGDVIGSQNLPSISHTVLAGTTPMPIVFEGPELAALPTSWQHQFRFELTDEYANPLLSFQRKLTELIGKRISLSYIPATQADADLIASYLPKPHADGSPILPSELPTSLPGYLIRLKPQISVDGQIVATSSTALTMGTDLKSTGGFTRAGDASLWDITDDTSHVAGQATAIGISPGGISAYQLDQLKARLQQTQSQLQAAASTPSNATAILANLTGEQISGDLLTATLWGWFAASESHNRLSQNQAGMVEIPGLSYGLFHAVAQPIYSWGVIRQVKFPGVNLDIGHIRNLSVAVDNDSQKWAGYNRLRGQYMSALEHAIPERFFNDPSKCNPNGTTTPVAGLPDCPQGISAIKAIGIAASQGQKIYTITKLVYQNNPNIVNSNLQNLSQSTKQGIQNALDAGYEVTAHERAITQSGWTGSGYTFIDPDTGAGGYIIDGGSNGGYLTWWATAKDGVTSNGTYIGLALAIVSTIAAVASVTASIVLMLALLSTFVAFINILVFDLQATEAGCPGMGSLGIGLELVAFVSGFFGAAGVALGAWLSFFTGGAVGSSVGTCAKFGGK